jgi:hypothetical protein
MYRATSNRVKGDNVDALPNMSKATSRQKNKANNKNVKAKDIKDMKGKKSDTTHIVNDDNNNLDDPLCRFSVSMSKEVENQANEWEMMTHLDNFQESVRNREKLNKSKKLHGGEYRYMEGNRVAAKIPYFSAHLAANYCIIYMCYSSEKEVRNLVMLAIVEDEGQKVKNAKCNLTKFRHSELKPFYLDKA